tara:strand:+ start:82 stop:1035 length:954 start_codon:yes stop_codon:yes gene_type:complete
VDKKNEIVWGKPPSDNISLEDCEWYHVMEIPGVGLTPSVSFDLRNDLDNILGRNVNYKDKKVINLGSITGHLSFEAERRGADVTSVDLSVDPDQMVKKQATERDWVPRANEDWKKDLLAFMKREVQRRNAFWYAHKALNSKSRLLISHANNLPKDLEMHDIGIIFSVLVHIRDPFLALQRMCSHINEKIVITELGGYPTYIFKYLPANFHIATQNAKANFLEKNEKLLDKIPNFISKRIYKNRPLQRFLPEMSRTASKWWAFNPEAIKAMLKILGFGKTKVNYHYYNHVEGEKVWNFTVIGERTVPVEKCDYDYDAN